MKNKEFTIWLYLVYLIGLMVIAWIWFTATW